MAMNELMNMAHMDEPLWMKNSLGGGEVLSLEEYAHVAAPSFAAKRDGFVTEATRASGVVYINSLALVELLMDVNRWTETFTGLVAKGTTLYVVSSGEGGTKSGALQVMKAEFQPISPLITVRTSKFLRFCKKQTERVWVFVDICLDENEGSSSNPGPTSMRLPSGCVVQDLGNGCCEVTWVEHVQYEETSINPLMRPMVSSGIGFGAKRWVATLQRYCECITLLMASSRLPQDPSMITMDGKKSLMKLSQKMVNSFYRGISIGSSNSVWEKLTSLSVDKDVRIMARRNSTDLGEPLGVTLSASTSVWLPVSRRRVFEFLMSERTRKDWDLQMNGETLHDVIRIPMAHARGNSVSVFRQNGGGDDNRDSLILQEMWNDTNSSLLVYATVDIPVMELAMSGADSSFIALLPSGFAIFPDGYNGGGDDGGNGASTSTGGGSSGGEGGCIMTVGFQFLASTVPNLRVRRNSLNTVNNILACTIQRIKNNFQIA
ncbi:Homeobox-leucine zipper protein HDG1 [Linum perenne]